MGLKKSNETELSVTSNSKPRRTFLKRASAGAILTSLPAHSVWGNVCTVSGAMSGNLSRTGDQGSCEKPNLPAGRSPGTWGALTDPNYREDSKPNKFKSVFVVTGSEKQAGETDAEASNRRNCLLDEIQTVAMNNSMHIANPELVGPAGRGGVFQYNVRAALATDGGDDYNLAAVWLNVYFGFPGITGPNDRNIAVANRVVSELVIWLSVQRQNNPSFEPNDSDWGFVDGSTNYSNFSCETIV